MPVNTSIHLTIARNLLFLQGGPHSLLSRWIFHGECRQISSPREFAQRSGEKPNWLEETRESVRLIKFYTHPRRRDPSEMPLCNKRLLYKRVLPNWSMLLRKPISVLPSRSSTRCFSAGHSQHKHVEDFRKCPTRCARSPDERWLEPSASTISGWFSTTYCRYRRWGSPSLVRSSWWFVGYLFRESVFNVKPCMLQYISLFEKHRKCLYPLNINFLWTFNPFGTANEIILSIYIYIFFSLNPNNVSCYS